MACRLDVPHIEIDAIHHLAGWQERSVPEMREIVLQRMSASPGGWVFDGNLRDLRDEVLSRVDAVIVIQLPFPVLFWRIFRRTVVRSWRSEELWNGNRESWRMSFASRNSILLEVWSKRHRYARYGETMAREIRPGTHYLVLRSGSDLDTFYRINGLERVPVRREGLRGGSTE